MKRFLKAITLYFVIAALLQSAKGALAEKAKQEIEESRRRKVRGQHVEAVVKEAGEKLGIMPHVPDMFRAIEDERLRVACVMAYLTLPEGTPCGLVRDEEYEGFEFTISEGQHTEVRVSYLIRRDLITSLDSLNRSMRVEYPENGETVVDSALWIDPQTAVGCTLSHVLIEADLNDLDEVESQARAWSVNSLVPA